VSVSSSFLKKSVLTFVGAALLLDVAQAWPTAQYTWKNVTVKGGGFIPGIVFNATQPGLAYLRTDIGGSYKWDNSAKKWIPLLDWCGTGNFQGSESIATDPVDPQRVYIAAGMGPGQAAILRSMDQGKTFQVVDVPFQMGGNSAGRGAGERLAIDPNDNNILYFGSRADGLWASKDAGETWFKVDGFPATSGLSNDRSVGLSFVVFDAKSGSRGRPTRSIYVGSADPGGDHLFHSADAGETWQAIPGQPANLIAFHAAFDTQGQLCVLFDTAAYPDFKGTGGAVWKLDPEDSSWTDITPVKGTNRPPGGYGGISIDMQHPGTLMVSTMNRKIPGGEDDERLYRSTDGGKNWTDITAQTHRDSSAAPYVPWAGAYDATARNPEATVGWWITTLAIDPFDSTHVCYATGATIWNCTDITHADAGTDTHWSQWTDGIEETAILCLISPPAGPHLISGFGDISGFTHDDLDVSPPQGPNRHPLFANTTWLDFAEKNPNIIVRVGSPPFHPPFEGTRAWSDDGGHSWKAFTVGDGIRSTRGGGGWGGDPPVILSADGATFMSLGRTPRFSTDHGGTWTAVSGLPSGLTPVADRANPAKFYALDLNDHCLYTSTNGGATFVNNNAVTGLDSAGSGGWGRPARFFAVGGREGDLWFVGNGLWHSTDGGHNFAEVQNHPYINHLGFGKAAPGKDYPVLYVASSYGSPEPGIYRSDDEGQTWVKLNDTQHQWGNRFECIAGDPRVYGRVYVGTNGRGILYGDIAE
jgi:hypothetical protein